MDHDVDVMVGLASHRDWPNFHSSVQQMLVQRGWHNCVEWYSTSATQRSSGSLAHGLSRADLLMCTRKNPKVSLDIATYITEGSVAYAQKYCVAGHGISGCWYPHEGTLYQGLGKLRTSAIRPLGRCKAGSISVPCPRKPMEILKAVLPMDSNASCLALPDVEKRRQRQTRGREGQLFRELTQEDVDILRSRAAELDREGFMSMTPYLDACWQTQKPPKGGLTGLPKCRGLQKLEIRL